MKYSHHTFNTLINYYLKMNNFEKLELYLADFCSKGIEIEIVKGKN